MQKKMEQIIFLIRNLFIVMANVICRNLLITFSLIIFTNYGIAATITTAGNGNWSSTTPDQPWPGGTIPASTDDIIVGANHTLTVDGNRTCNSIKVGNGSTLSVSSSITLTVTNALTFPHINQANVTGTLSGSGNVSCGSFNAGDATTTSGTNNVTYTTTVTSTVSTV